MDSADAAPPPKAPPLPSEASATTNTASSIRNPKASVSPQEAPATAAVSASATTASKASASITATNTTTKKRPLASTNNISVEAAKPKGVDSSTQTLVAPALKSKTKETPLKAKKTLKKKKKKKFSSILSGMMKPKKELDVHAERESLRKTLGGGNFSKVDKI